MSGGYDVSGGYDIIKEIKLNDCQEFGADFT